MRVKAPDSQINHCISQCTQITSGKLLRHFAKTDSLLSVLVAALSYRKTFLSPWFSDSCHILFKKETLRAPPMKKQGASHAAHIRTQGQDLLGTVGRKQKHLSPTVRLQISAMGNEEKTLSSYRYWYVVRKVLFHKQKATGKPWMVYGVYLQSYWCL